MSGKASAVIAEGERLVRVETDGRSGNDEGQRSSPGPSRALVAGVAGTLLVACTGGVQGTSTHAGSKDPSHTVPSSASSATSASQADATEGADGEKLLGVWELARYDNIPGHSLPPGGMVNLTYRFLPEGKSVHFIPGREGQPYGRGNTPFDKYVPYALEGEKFTGWLGLTNDLTGPKKLVFKMATTIQVIFSDGSIATLRRIEDDPSATKLPELRCVPFTIRGSSYDPKRIAEIERRLSGPDDDARGKLKGKWYVPGDGGRGKPTSLEFLEDGTFERTDWHGPEPSKSRGIYELHGGVLAVHMEGTCPQSLVSFADGRMELSFSEGQATSLWRSPDDIVASPLTVPAFYSFSVVNESDAELKEVALTEPKLRMGDVRLFGSSGSMNIRALFPKVIKAEWTRNGDRKTGELSTAGLAPEGFQVDEITVVISPDDKVAVRFDSHAGGTVVPGELDADKLYREASERYREAVRQGDDRAAIKVLKRIQSKKDRSFFDIRPLTVAINHGRVAVVKAALRRGDPNESNSSGRTALGAAARQGNLAIVRALVRAGANVDPAGDGPLESAASKGAAGVVRFLLKKGADPNREAGGQFPLIGAIRSKDRAVVRLLLEAGADPNLRFVGQTPAEFAKRMRAGDEAVQLLEAAAQKGKPK